MSHWILLLWLAIFFMYLYRSKRFTNFFKAMSGELQFEDLNLG